MCRSAAASCHDRLCRSIAVALTDVAGAHCLAEAMGGLYGHPHGYCCAVSMPPIMEYNLGVSGAKYARLAQTFGIEREGRSDDDLARLAIEFIRHSTTTSRSRP